MTPPALTAADEGSFAYKTMKDRLPVIVVKVIDFLHRQKRELYKFGGTIETPNETEQKELEEEAKAMIPFFTRLRKDLETNKPVTLFEKMTLDPETSHFNEDVDLWNEYLIKHKFEDGSMPRYFDSRWLLMECYLYRKMKEGTLLSKHLRLFDLFVEHKQAACKAALEQMIIVATHLKQVDKETCESDTHTHPTERSEFRLFVQLALWANKSDLSLTAMNADNMPTQTLAADIRSSLEELQENILCDNISELWFRVQAIKELVRSPRGTEKTVYIDLVADNSGYEMFIDLCLLHFLALVFCPISLESSGIKFRIHVKRMPWYVSDTTKKDLRWLLSYITDPSQDPTLKDVGDKWKYFFNTDFFEIHQDKFWTLPHEFVDMPTVAPELYESLKESSLIIFKGDLNYRKLIGDRRWHVLTPFKAALRGFEPAPLVSLRTCKADVVAGIEDVSVFAKINNNELPRDWMVTGDYGLIQYLCPA